MNAYPASQVSGNNSLEQAAGALSGRDFNVAPLSTTGTPWRRMVSPERRAGARELEGYELEMAAFQAEHKRSLAEIERQFIFDGDRTPIVEFLDQHRTIPQIVLESVVPLKQQFGPDVNFMLRAPLEDDGLRMLYVVVPWAGTVEAARDALARFDEAWWLAHSYQASGHLTFVYELV